MWVQIALIAAATIIIVGVAPVIFVAWLIRKY